MRHIGSAAETIRDELVCCNIYERMSQVAGSEQAWRELRRSSDYHAICFYGEWSARIAEKWGQEND